MTTADEPQAGPPWRAFLDRPDTIVVIATANPTPDTSPLLLALGADGIVTAFNGHVDLGTGIRTALAQIVAEELDVTLDRVAMVLGGTDLAPNQGATIASETIQIAAAPLRRAAACARRYLLGRAALALGLSVDDLAVVEGVAMAREDVGRPTDRRVAYADLARGRHDPLVVVDDVPLKSVADYTVVGRSVARVDIPAKATGVWTFVHDVRVPGMVHGRVVRPPYAGVDSGAHVGASLVAVDETSIADVPGVLGVVVIRDFIGVVALREEDAAEAARRLAVTWKEPPALPPLDAPEAALRGNPATPRKLLDRGDVDRALGAATTAMKRIYVWPYQMHASIGPSCAVADFRGHTLTVWSGTQNPYPLRADLAKLLGLEPQAITIHRFEAAGCYGRNCADDVGADAALLSRAVGRPVRVQLTREQEHAWEPKGAAQVMDVSGGLDAEGGPAAYDFETRFPSNGAPTLALLLTGAIPPKPEIFEMGDRTAIPPYAYGNARVRVHDMPPIVRASWFRGVSALPNTFAHESFIDELATAAGVDPIDYRLRYLADPRGADLVRAVAERARWTPRTRPGTQGGAGDLLFGRGFAYAVYVHGPFPGKSAAWAAWVADVAVNTVTGAVMVTKVVAGQDAGLMINPGGVRQQIHGNVIQATSRVLKEQVIFSGAGVSSREWGAYPILAFPEVPEIDVLMLERLGEPPLGVGESTTVPSAAAIANAIFDATGVRFREMPLTPERILAGLAGRAAPPPLAPPPAPRKSRWRAWSGIAAGFGAVLSAATIGVAPPTFAPIARPDPNVFSPATIARGRIVAALGACNVCHVGPGGIALAGGRGLETPFGVVHASNITPDPEAGIGAWSYPAFERAMRRGISRDGHHLYPAHPYPSFAKVSEADLEALYAYLMAAPPASTRPPATALRFPFGERRLMALWNALFLRAGPATTQPARSEAWNRGAYLVESLGHCGACHTPRNALGAERRAAALAGGHADGWDAPALTTLSAAPIPWDEASLYDYLRRGHAAHHGGAAGPMAEVVAALEPVPDADIRAMAVYLASLAAPALAPDVAAARAAELAAAADRAEVGLSRGARIFTGACASCHGEGAALTSLALNANLHAARPNNVIQAILNGIDAPASRSAALGGDDVDANMPAYRDSLGDGDIAELVAYCRARFAPDAPPWEDIGATIARLRGTRAGP
jgi:nicotinate dehydrogenase subunit B